MIKRLKEKTNCCYRFVSYYPKHCLSMKIDIAKVKKLIENEVLYYEE